MPIISHLLFSLSTFDMVFVDSLFPPIQSGSKILGEWSLVMDAVQKGINYCGDELIPEMSFLNEQLLSLSLLKHGKLVIDAIEQFSAHLEETKNQKVTV